jgi:hypothetical protein
MWIDYVPPEPTATQVQAQANPPRNLVPLLTLITQLNALTTAQKTNIWNDLTSGSPPKWELDAGPNASAIAVLQFIATLTPSLSATDLLNAKVRGVAMYVQDNPTYLVNPVFDPTINIPGRV